MAGLAGKRTLVTGAASGIGRGIAELFASDGASVLMVDINGEAVAEAAHSIRGRTEALACDVSVASEVEKAVEAAVSLFGGLDVVVNNAGVEYVAPLLEHDEAEFDRVLAVNLRGVFLGTKYGARALAASGGGAIVNVASIAGMQGAVPGHAAYGASKAGVIALTKSAALELRPLGIRANVVCPGVIQTPMVDAAAAQFQELTGASLTDVVNEVQGRMGTTGELAAAVAFLASDAASLVSGVVLPVDGAITARVF